MDRYEAVFECVGNGKFTVVCYGWFKRDKRIGCVFPTVEEAREEYSSNARFVGVK